MPVAKSVIIDYLNYAKDVLGIKHLFFIGEQVTLKKVVVSVTDLKDFSGPERELLDKMISALNLDSQTTVVIDSNDLVHYKPQFLLKLSVTVSVDQPVNTIETFSPRLLMDNPGLKKQAWSQMQSFLQLLK